MIINTNLVYINDENFKYFSSQEILYKNLNPYGTVSWLMSKKGLNDKAFIIKFIDDQNSIYLINGLIKEIFNIKFIHTQSGILFKNCPPSFEQYHEILKAFKSCLREKLNGILTIRFEPLYQTSAKEKRALFSNDFCLSPFLQNSGFSRLVINTELTRKIKKEIKRFNKSEIEIKAYPLKTHHVKNILVLFNKIAKSKGLTFDNRMNIKTLNKMIKFFGENINLIIAEHNNEIVGFSLWLDTANNSIYFRGASNRSYGSLGIGYALVQEKINIFLEGDINNERFIDLGGIGRRLDTYGVDKFKERFNSYEVEYIGAFDYTFSFIGKIILQIIYFIRKYIKL